jgi:predicted DNA-binding protein
VVSSLGKLVNVSIKVPEETKKLMKKVNVNWSEYLREVIESKIKMEVAKDAAKKLDEIRQRIKGVSIEEIIRWIREDRERNLE